MSRLEGVCLIHLNQQGHGESEACWEKFDFDHLADDVCDLMDRLEIKKAYFAGISMGAAVCLNLAVRYPPEGRKASSDPECMDRSSYVR